MSIVAPVPASILTAALALSGCSVFFPSSADPKGGGSSTVHAVVVNSVGYLPDSTKLGTANAVGNGMVEIRAEAGDALVWTGTLTGPMNDTGDPLYIADFSEVTTPGRYYLQVPDLGKSTVFTIGADIYADVLTRSLIGMYGQRCGTAVHIQLGGDTWSHGACHMNDASMKYLANDDQRRPSIGGWHDAGDYGKYTTNGAFSAGIMLAAWDRFQAKLVNLSLPIPEQGGSTPDFLDEVKWEIDWLLTLPDADGGVPHKLTALDFEPFIMPESDISQRYFTPVGTAATADFVAVAAAAARIYRPYDADFADRCLVAARLGYEYLAAHSGPAVPATADFHTGGYGDSNDADERVWAVAELWEATGEPALLTDLEARIARADLQTNFDWQNVVNLGLFQYLTSPREGRNPDLVARLQASLLATTKTLIASTTGSSWGRPIGYWWGANGAVARTAMNLAVADALSPDAKNRDAIVSALDHLLGRNYYDRSMVTMVGYNPPMNPHHRPSASDGSMLDPWPGLLVGGQDCSGPNGGNGCAGKSKYDWQDQQSAPNLNEIAVNWNAALIYAAAALAP